MLLCKTGKYLEQVSLTTKKYMVEEFFTESATRPIQSISRDVHTHVQSAY